MEMVEAVTEVAVIKQLLSASMLIILFLKIMVRLIRRIDPTLGKSSRNVNISLSSILHRDEKFLFVKLNYKPYSYEFNKFIVFCSDLLYLFYFFRLILFYSSFFCRFLFYQI